MLEMSARCEACNRNSLNDRSPLIRFLFLSFNSRLERSEHDLSCKKLIATYQLVPGCLDYQLEALQVVVSLLVFPGDPADPEDLEAQLLRGHRDLQLLP